MKLPTELFLSTIKSRQVYFFSNEQIKTPIPHYFICICIISEGNIFFVCCTSQFEKRKNFIEKRNLPSTTLVWLKPDTKNGLKKDSYVDCNSYYPIPRSKIRNLYENDNIEYSGEISEDHYIQILKGLIASPLIEENLKEYITPILNALEES